MGEPELTSTLSPLIRRVKLQNYRSIARCDVTLGPLTFLVGPNGSGKSNFLNALAFVMDALTSTLDLALRLRGGIREVRRRSAGRPTHFGICLECNLPSGASAVYAFRVGTDGQGVTQVQQEECAVSGAGGQAIFRSEHGKIVHDSSGLNQPVSPDRLHLVLLSGTKEFRELYDCLSRMGFYNLDPAAVRDLQPADAGGMLSKTGSNISSVYSRLPADVRMRIVDYLARIVEGITGVEPKQIAGKETLEFLQASRGSSEPWKFLAANMSDGTLRAAAILVALLQRTNGGRSGIPLVGIEEPELALHPAAAGVLLDALREAGRTSQVIVTSHSPDLLDSPDIDTDWLRAVKADEGRTVIGPVDDAGRQALRDGLFTPGELLRLNQLAPAPSSSCPDDTDTDEPLQTELDLGKPGK